MSKNNITIQDKDGDYCDWIELYNNTSTSISLLNYSLSDDNSNLLKWTFPDITLQPHGYLLIFASDKNRIDTNELHTNFKISSGGEALYLSNNVGVTIDQTSAISLSSDQSYGRIPDGSINWIIINTPSPLASNNNSNQLLFSHSEGFYTNPFTLKITNLLPDTIYYTLNGDVPTESSNYFIDSIFIDYKDTTSNVLSEVVTTPSQNLIGYKAWESPSKILDKATILRCVTYKNGVRTSRIYSKTYFVASDIINRYSMPIVSLITQGDNLFNNDSGIYVPGVHFDINDPNWTGNYCMHGDDWERDVHIEYFKQNGIIGFSQNAGMRIHGGGSRVASQKSLRLYARNEYGEQYFNYRLLSGRNVTKYKRFLLRASMGDWHGQTIIKDVLAQDLSSKLNLDFQHFQPVIVYLNGEYWGIHTIRDRIDERYISYLHNIDKDSVEFKDTYPIDYNNLMDFIEKNSLEIDSNYEHVKSQVEIDNYIDYTIAELFFKNYDWPANNMKIWRNKNNGKWRWVLYDLDASFGNANYNMLLHSTLIDSSVAWPNSPESTFLFRNLLKNSNFSKRFIKRYAEILNEVYNVDIMTKRLDSITNIYKSEIPEHCNRWFSPNDYSSWKSNIEKDITTFIHNRPCAVQGNIMNYFELSTFGFDCNQKELDTSNTSAIIIAPNPNNGHFFLFNNSDDIENAQIIISNMNGLVVYREDKVDLLKHHQKHLQLGHLSNGTYILHFVSYNYSERIKIVIVN
ncbi:MAG: CotH kinase family protein [Bacteroidales bacterium]|nr:CotH kinase family protein [Bacteroidales bacterium]